MNTVKPSHLTPITSLAGIDRRGRNQHGYRRWPRRSPGAGAGGEN